VGQTGKKGKTLVIWDANARERLRDGEGYNKVTMGAQRRLVQVIRKKMQLTEVWLGGDGNEGDNRCLQLTMDWLRGLMERG
jgi:hypothetical protein